ncbi:hypothetical protein Tco_1098211 [Tanacetum coccineum]
MQAWDKFLEFKHAQSEENLPTSSYDDDDDKESSIPLRDIIMSELPPCVAITPDTPKPDSLIIEDKHLDTTPKTESDEFIKYSVENLVQNSSESRLIFLRDEFAGELTRLQSIPPRIDNINLDPEGDILFLESLLYDNSSPRPPKAFQANSNTIIESLPIFIDALREEIDILHGPDDSVPPGIESDDFNSEDEDNSTSLPEFKSFHVDYPDLGDSTIDVVEDIPVDVPNILPTHSALHMDFDFIPSHNDLGSDLDVSSPFRDTNKIYDPRICFKIKSTRFLATLSPMINTLLLFSSKNKIKVFNHGVLVSKEKSPSSLSHRGFKASKLSLHKSPMLIHGDNTLNLGDFPDCEDSRASGFVLHSLEFYILSFILGIQYPNLID